MIPETVTIRPIRADEHGILRACEDIQQQAWNTVDREIVPMHMLVTVARYGGVVLGAFAGQDLVGFLFGYPGLLAADDPRAEWLGTRVIHCSEMLGVRPGWQERGIGFALKQAQREHVLALDTRLVTWTFDPLMSRNAHLNIARLGGIVRSYRRNEYGELHGINAGLVTDRLELEWWIASERVAEHLAGRAPALALADARFVNPARLHAGGLRAPAAEVAAFDAPLAAVEIPGDFQAVKAANPGLAGDWQAHIRALLEEALAAGYVITGLASRLEGAERRSFYLLERGFNVPALAGRSGEGGGRED